MTKDDFLSCISREEYDNVPTFLYDTSFGTHYADIPVSDIYKNGYVDGELSAKCILASRKVLGHDCVIGAVDCTDVRAFGGVFELFTDRQPICIKRPFEDIGYMDGYSPSDIDGKSLDNFVLSYDIINERDPDCAVAATIPSPLLSAAVHRGLEPLLMDMSSDQQLFMREMRFATEVGDIILERLLNETESDAVLIPGAYDNVDLIGLDNLKKYALPGLEHVYSCSKAFGKGVIFHPHGVLTKGDGIKALDSFIDVGFECIYYGEGNDHLTITDLCKDRASTMGGVDTFTTIHLGPDKRVIKNTKEVLEKTKNKNHVFTCSCSIDRGLDPHRMELMMGTVRSFPH